MTDKQFETQKNRVRKYVTKWRNLLGLWGWTGGTSWSDERKKGEPEGVEILAEVYADWKYLDYNIMFYLPGFPKKSNRDIERYVMHEMSHILVNEMREDGIEHEERVVSHITNVLECVYEAGQKNPIKKVVKKKAKKK